MMIKWSAQQGFNNVYGAFVLHVNEMWYTAKRGKREAEAEGKGKNELTFQMCQTIIVVAEKWCMANTIFFGLNDKKEEREREKKISSINDILAIIIQASWHDITLHSVALCSLLDVSHPIG